MGAYIYVLFLIPSISCRQEIKDRFNLPFISREASASNCWYFGYE